MLYCKIIYAVTIALLLSGCATSNNTENNSDTGDAFMTTSEEELTGPGGLKVSCVYIARFDNIEKRRDLVGIETGIYDSQKIRYKDSQKTRLFLTSNIQIGRQTLLVF